MKKVINFAFSILAVLLTCLYPCAFLYLQNVDEAGPVGMVVPFVIYTMVAFVIFCVMIMVYWKMDKAAIATCVFMILFMNFVLMQNLINLVLPFVTYLHFTIVLLIAWIAFLVFVKKKDIDTEIWCKIICAIFGLLIVVNFLGAIPKFTAKKEIKDVKVEEYAKDKTFAGNVYYIILDEYAGDENLEYFYNYDNSDIKNYLEDKGFSWSGSTRNLESISTFEIIPNILNLDYVTEIDGIPNTNLQYTKDPVLYRFFKDMGYQINLVNHENFLVSDNYKVLTHSRFSFAETGSTSLSKSIINQGYVSILYNTVGKMFNNQNTEDSAKDLEDAMNYTRDSYKYTDGKPTLTVCYLQCPHMAFVFDENGNYNDSKNLENWADDKYYLGQLKYTNTFIKETVDNIIENDPNSIIVFQADHGARYSYYNMNRYKKSEYDAKKETRMMQNVINAVYIGGDTKIDIEGKSCINTWRTILNTVYKTDYEMLDAPDDYVYKWRYINTQR